MSQSSPDFSRLNAKQRKLLNLRVMEYGPKIISRMVNEPIDTIGSRQKRIASLLGMPIAEATLAWKEHPYRNNPVFWDIVDTLREESRKCR